MDKSTFDRFFRDFHFVDCAVRSKDAVYLLGRKEYEVEEGLSDPDEPDIVKRFLNIFFDRPVEDRFGRTDLEQFDITNIEVTQFPQPHAVAVDFDGQVCARGKGFTGMESAVAFDDVKGPHRGGTLRLRNIGGYVYSVGNKRGVCRREGPNHWVPLWGDSLPVPKVKDIPDFNAFGFKGIDGFSPEDLYVAGGKGDVWHFDGKLWKQIPFPSNMALYNVCCAGDGQVYIGAQSGNVFRGRGNKWEHIHKGGISLRFVDMVWFQGSVWCTNDYGIWTITDGKLSLATLPKHICSCAGHASAADGIMVMAGMYGAAMHNGKEWVNLVDLPELYRQYGA